MCTCMRIDLEVSYLTGCISLWLAIGTRKPCIQFSLQKTRQTQLEQLARLHTRRIVPTGE
jgi:hypothetical protein